MATACPRGAEIVIATAGTTIGFGETAIGGGLASCMVAYFDWPAQVFDATALKKSTHASASHHGLVVGMAGFADDQFIANVAAYRCAR
jgi:hypothetical protein